MPTQHICAMLSMVFFHRKSLITDGLQLLWYAPRPPKKTVPMPSRRIYVSPGMVVSPQTIIAGCCSMALVCSMTPTTRDPCPLKTYLQCLVWFFHPKNFFTNGLHWLSYAPRPTKKRHPCTVDTYMPCLVCFSHLKSLLTDGALLLWYPPQPPNHTTHAQSAHICSSWYGFLNGNHCCRMVYTCFGMLHDPQNRGFMCTRDNFAMPAMVLSPGSLLMNGVHLHWYAPRPPNTVPMTSTHICSA